MHHRRCQGKILAIAFALIVALSISFAILRNGSSTSYGYYSLAASSLMKAATPMTMKEWRNDLRSKCQAYVDRIQQQGANITDIHLEQKEQFEIAALNDLYIPDNMTIDQEQQTSQSNRFCDHVFIDLGTNRGDTIAASVDAVVDVCTPIFLEADPTLKKAYRISRNFPHYHVDYDSNFQIHTKGYKGFGLTTKLQKYFASTDINEVCVYGMEGNPYFTSHLWNLERTINSIRPKPLQHLKIYTETVVSPTDGETTLYVDQVSDKNHFWGSSLIKSMPDVRKTAKKLNNGTMVEAHINGMTLTTLLKKTLKVFDPSSSKSNRSPSSVLVKMDVEGAEYAIIKEVAQSGILCEYLQMASNNHNHNATILIEYHQRLFSDQEEKQKHMDGLKEARQKLKDCGVQIQQLPNFFTG